MNRKLFRIVIGFWCLFIITACDKGDYRIVAIPEPATLEVVAEKVISQDCAAGILTADSLVIIANRCGPSAFSVYRSDDLEEVAHFGIMGGRLSEFDSPFFYNDTGYDDPQLTVYDVNRLEEKQIDLPGILAGENVYTCVKDVRLPKDIYWARNLGRSAGKVIGCDVDLHPERGVFFIYDPPSGKKKYVEYDPKYSFRRDQTNYFAYYNELFVNSAEGKVAVAYRHLDMVGLYDLDGKTLHRTVFSKLRKPLENRNMAIVDHSYPVFHINIFGCGEYFFAVRFDMTMDDYSQNPGISKQTTTILKFDWDGNLLGSLLAPCDVITITCNNAGDTFYGIVPTDDPEYARLLILH